MFLNYTMKKKFSCIVYNHLLISPSTFVHLEVLFVIGFAQESRRTNGTGEGTQLGVGNLVVLQLRGAKESLAALRLRTGEVPLVVVSLHVDAQVALIRQNAAANRAGEA